MPAPPPSATGSSPWRQHSATARPARCSSAPSSTTPTALPPSSSRGSTSSLARLTVPPTPTAACARPTPRAATSASTPPPRPSCVTTASSSPRVSSPTTARRSTRRPRFTARTRRCPSRTARLFKHCGFEVKGAVNNIGLEQELFFIPREAYQRRMDLQFTGRTVLGKMPARGQELCDHYMCDSLPLPLSPFPSPSLSPHFRD